MGSRGTTLVACLRRPLCCQQPVVRRLAPFR